MSKCVTYATLVLFSGKVVHKKPAISVKANKTDPIWWTWSINHCSALSLQQLSFLS